MIKDKKVTNRIDLFKYTDIFQISKYKVDFKAT